MNLKEWFEEFGKTKYSSKKKLINALVTTKKTYHTQNIKFQKIFNNVIWVYAFWILLVATSSIVMLTFTQKYLESHRSFITTIESVIFITLATDFILRWYTAEVRLKKGNWSYVLYPFTFSGLILLLALIPSIYIIGIWTDFPLFKQFQSMKFLRIFRIILLTNLIPSFGIFRRVLKKEAKILYTVFALVLLIIVLFAIVIFNIEEGIDINGKKPDDVGYDKTNVPFDDFWSSLYYATVTLTTIGFGDKVPHTHFGQGVTMVMSIIGIAVLATPSGVIAGGFVSEVRKVNEIKLKKKIKK